MRIQVTAGFFYGLTRDPSYRGMSLIAVTATVIIFVVVAMACTREREFHLDEETFGIPISQTELMVTARGESVKLPQPFTLDNSGFEFGVVTFSHPSCPDGTGPSLNFDRAGEWFLDLAGELAEIEEHGRTSVFKTQRGIGLGSSYRDVLRAYGKPMFTASPKYETWPSELRPKPTLPRIKSIDYYEKVGNKEYVLIFLFDNDVVFWMLVGPRQPWMIPDD